MTGLHARFGWPVTAVRTVLELSALGAGWALGMVGLGTAVFAFGVGPALVWFLRAMPSDSRPDSPPRVCRADSFVPRRPRQGQAEAGR
jgi:hypothetical protein